MLDDTETEKPLMIALLDLDDRMCRWPIGDPKDKRFGFCGHATAHGKSYCRQHQALAWSAQRVVTRARKNPEKMARAA